MMTKVKYDTYIRVFLQRKNHNKRNTCKDKKTEEKEVETYCSRKGTHRRQRAMRHRYQSCRDFKEL